MSEPTSKTRVARQWQIDLCQEAQGIVSPSLGANEAIVAATHTQPGLPAILRRLPLGHLLSPLLATFGSNAIRPGILAVTQKRLLAIDLNEQALVLSWPLSMMHARFRRRPLFLDELLVETGEERRVVLAIPLAGNWIFLRRALEEHSPL